MKIENNLQFISVNTNVKMHGDELNVLFAGFFTSITFIQTEKMYFKSPKFKNRKNLYRHGKEKWRMLKSRNIQTKETQRNSIFKPNNILSGNSELRFARF